VKAKIAAVALATIAVLLSPINTNSATAINEKCAIYDFKEIFFADFRTGSKWDNSQGARTITWSAGAMTIYDEDSVRPFTETEIDWIRSAFKSWDDALNTVTFLEVAPSETPEVVIGFVGLKPSNVQLTAMGFWNTWVENGKRYKATIKLKAADKKWFAVRSQFIHTVQHELGNVLGLGDLKPSKSFASVLEDPWQPPYGKPALGTTDVAMIRQLYGETSCANSSTIKL
jgi:hypothetical protein